MAKKGVPIWEIGEVAAMGDCWACRDAQPWTERHDKVEVTELHGAKVGVAVGYFVDFYLFIAEAETVDDVEPKAAPVVVVDFLQSIVVEIGSAAVGEVGNEVGGL